MVKNKKMWIKNIDYILRCLITIFIGMLLLSQGLLLKEGTRLYLSKVDKMEGEDLASAMPLDADMPLQITEEATVIKHYQNLLRRSKIIVIKKKQKASDSTISIMINGKKIDDFGKGDCRLTVYDGDYVEIDGTSLNEIVDFVVEVPDKGLLSPQDGLIVRGKKEIFPIGKIKFKNE